MVHSKGKQKNRKTVLVVDDDPALLGLIRSMLSMHYRVVLAEGAETAIQIVQQESFRIDLVLTDVRMPGMTGTELAEHLLRFRPGLRVLFMSAFYDDDNFRFRLLNEGIGFLMKPFQQDGLFEAVQAALEAPAAEGLASNGALSLSAR